MYQTWSWPTAGTGAQAANVSGSASTTATGVPWTTTASAYGQYAVPGSVTPQWGWTAPGQYGCVPNMAMGQPAANSFPGSWPTTTNSQVPTSVEVTSNQTTSNTEVTTNTSQSSNTNKQKDSSQDDKLEQLRALAQQWSSQQQASTYGMAPSPAAAMSGSLTTAAMTMPPPTQASAQWPQATWNQGSWTAGQWPQQQWPSNWIPPAQQASNTNQPPPPPTTDSSSGQTNAQLQQQQKEISDKLADIDKEEKEFDHQFQEWEKQFEAWKSENMSHPDKEAFANYEKQWQEWREQLLEKKDQMQKKREGLESEMKKISVESSVTKSEAVIVSSATQSIPGLDLQDDNLSQGTSSSTPMFSTGMPTVAPVMYMPPQPFMFPPAVPPPPPHMMMHRPPPQNPPSTVNSSQPPMDQPPPAKKALLATPSSTGLLPAPSSRFDRPMDNNNRPPSLLSNQPSMESNNRSLVDQQTGDPNMSPVDHNRPPMGPNRIPMDPNKPPMGNRSLLDQPPMDRNRPPMAPNRSLLDQPPMDPSRPLLHHNRPPMDFNQMGDPDGRDHLGNPDQFMEEESFDGDWGVSNQNQGMNFSGGRGRGRGRGGPASQWNDGSNFKPSFKDDPPMDENRGSFHNEQFGRRDSDDKFGVPEGEEGFGRPSNEMFCGPPNEEFEGLPNERFGGPLGERFKGPGDRFGGAQSGGFRGGRFGAAPGGRFGGPLGGRFGGPPGEGFGGSPSERFGGSQGERFGGPPGERFGGPQGERFGKGLDEPYGEGFGGAAGERFKGPPGNEFEETPGFRGPVGDGFKGPPGKSFGGPIDERFRGQPGKEFRGPGFEGSPNMGFGRPPGERFGGPQDEEFRRPPSGRFGKGDFMRPDDAGDPSGRQPRSFGDAPNRFDDMPPRDFKARPEGMDKSSLPPQRFHESSAKAVDPDAFDPEACLVSSKFPPDPPGEDSQDFTSDDVQEGQFVPPPRNFIPNEPTRRMLPMEGKWNRDPMDSDRFNRGPPNMRFNEEEFFDERPRFPGHQFRDMEAHPRMRNERFPMDRDPFVEEEMMRQNRFDPPTFRGPLDEEKHFPPFGFPDDRGPPRGRPRFMPNEPSEDPEFLQNRPRPFHERGFMDELHRNSIDYTHRPAVSILGDDFGNKYNAFDQQFGCDLINYRDSYYMGHIPPPPQPKIISQVDVDAFDYNHGKKPLETSVIHGKKASQDSKSPFSNKAVFDYAHRRDSPHGDPNMKRGELPMMPQLMDRDKDRSRDRNRDRDRRDRPVERERDRQRDRSDRDKNERRDKDDKRDRDDKRDKDHDRSKDRDRGEKRSRWESRNDSNKTTTKEKSPEKQSPRKQNGDRSRDVKPAPTQIPPSNIFKTESIGETVQVKDILDPPNRFNRPKQLVIILRGLPGSGKSYVAKLIKDKEVEHGGCTPRILSLDDYFMVEVEVTDTDPDTGKKVKKKEFKYEYEACMEESYRTSLLRSFKKTIDEKFFPFIIVDGVHNETKQYEPMWSYAKQRGFQVYVAEMDSSDLSSCHKRNIHNRTLEDIQKIKSKWDTKPKHFLNLDTRPLLQDVAIPEVEMEDSVTMEQDKAEDDDEEEDDKNEAMHFHTPSRWEKLEATEEKLDKLDGLRASKKKHSTMEDYLQLPEDYDERQCQPGKKRVRWADLEQRKEQDRMRAIGFVVGQTDWSKMTDPTQADKALTKTKYI